MIMSQMMMNGFKFFNGHKLVTIFSASHYYPDKVMPTVNVWYPTVSLTETGYGAIIQLLSRRGCHTPLIIGYEFQTVAICLRQCYVAKNKYKLIQLAMITQPSSDDRNPSVCPFRILPYSSLFQLNHGAVMVVDATGRCGFRIIMPSSRGGEQGLKVKANERSKITKDLRSSSDFVAHGGSFLHRYFYISIHLRSAVCAIRPNRRF